MAVPWPRRGRDDGQGKENLEMEEHVLVLKREYNT